MFKYVEMMRKPIKLILYNLQSRLFYPSINSYTIKIITYYYVNHKYLL